MLEKPENDGSEGHVTDFCKAAPAYTDFIWFRNNMAIWKLGNHACL